MAAESVLSREAFETGRENRRPQSSTLAAGWIPCPKNLDNGACKIYNQDMPDVIGVRDRIFPAGEREENIACDLNDLFWLDRIDAAEGAVFFACGVFYYFTKENAQRLFCAMNDRFPGCGLVFDTCGKTALKIMLKGIVRESVGIDRVSGYFHAGDPEKEIVPWPNGFSVSHKGYMLGCRDLKAEGVSGTYRFLARVCDGIMKMRIVRLGFGQEEAAGTPEAKQRVFFCGIYVPAFKISQKFGQSIEKVWPICYNKRASMNSERRLCRTGCS